MSSPFGSDDPILAFARRLLSVDISRRRLTEGRPISFVQWYIILELFIAERESRAVVITDLVHLAGHPRSTTLKTIADMVKGGSVLRRPDPTDRRRVFINLENAFHTRVAEILLELMKTVEEP